MRERLRSKQIFHAASRVLPGGVNSPVRSFPGLSLTPLVVKQGSGAIITDEDGEEYIDFCCSWGALILGHAHPAVTKAAQEQLGRGASFGITTGIETEFAEWMSRLYPSMEKVRFVSSGTEATMTAIRLARGFTGKPTIIKFEGNYHGHADCLLVKAGSGVANLPESSSAGVPGPMVQHTLCLPYNDPTALREALRKRNDIAAVIVEPVAGNMGVVLPIREFLSVLREETEKNGALLIFDEVITGFRIGLQGAQGHYGIVPDLTCLGKIIGGGFPAAAFGGRAEIMDKLAPIGNVYQAGTLSGFPVAMAAGKAAVEQVLQPGFYQDLEAKSSLFSDPIVKTIEEGGLPLCLQRAGSMMTLFFGAQKVERNPDLRVLDGDAYRAFFQFLFERGIYIPPLQQEAWFISSAHTEKHLKKTSSTIIEFLNSYYEDRQVLQMSCSSASSASLHEIGSAKLQ